MATGITTSFNEQKKKAEEILETEVRPQVKHYEKTRKIDD
jgi:hypothetical protein